MPAINGERLVTFEEGEEESEYGYIRKVTFLAVRRVLPSLGFNRLSSLASLRHPILRNLSALVYVAVFPGPVAVLVVSVPRFFWSGLNV
jgi:hypothetical protein